MRAWTIYPKRSADAAWREKLKSTKADSEPCKSAAKRIDWVSATAPRFDNLGIGRHASDVGEEAHYANPLFKLRLQNNFDAAVALVAKDVVHLGTIFEARGMCDHERRIDLIFCDTFHQVVRPPIHMGLSHSER